MAPSFAPRLSLSSLSRPSRPSFSGLPTPPRRVSLSLFETSPSKAKKDQLGATTVPDRKPGQIQAGWVDVKGLAAASGGSIWKGSWSRRWFVLEEHTLSVFTDQTASRPLTVLFLGDISRVTRDSSSSIDRPSVLSLTLRPTSTARATSFTTSVPLSPAATSNTPSTPRRLTTSFATLARSPLSLSVSRSSRLPEPILLSFPSDATLYTWYDELYSRVGLSSSAKIISVAHDAHVGLDSTGTRSGIGSWHVKGGQGLPKGWKSVVRQESNETMTSERSSASGGGVEERVGRWMERVGREEETKREERRERERERAAMLLVKKSGLRGGWIWSKRWVQFADGTLVVKSQMQTTLPTQSQIFPLSSLQSVTRSSLKPNCLRLQFFLSSSSTPASVATRAPSQTFYLSLSTEAEMQDWLDELHARKGGLSISSPGEFKHVVRVDMEGIKVNEDVVGLGGAGGKEVGGKGSEEIWKALAGMQGISVDELKKQARGVREGAEKRRKAGGLA